MNNVWRLGTNWGGADIFDLVLSSKVGFYYKGSEEVAVGDYVAIAAFHSYEVGAVGIVSSEVLPLEELLTDDEKQGSLKQWVGDAKGFRFSIIARLDGAERFKTKNYLQFYSLANDPDAWQGTVKAIEKVMGKAMIADVGDMVKEHLNCVLTGAPGTGKTYLARKIAMKITEGKEGHVLNVQFHPSYGYSDFVEGLRPVKKGTDEIGFERRDGVFMELCRKALKHKEDNYVIVIDEINRGDISKILGELFSLIEVDYRTFDGKGKNDTFVAVKTQYNNLMDDGDIFKNGFFVPPNVYIIGTMNDVDRSVESMDFAIRRRFVWHEVNPKDRFDAMWGEDNVEGVERESVKARMNDLNEMIKTDQALGEAYQIGPSYFMKLKDLNGDYKRLWDQSLRLLLKEYLRGIPDAQTKLDELHSVLVKAPTE